MTKLEIIDDLKIKHQLLYELLHKHPDQNWIKGPKNKWNTGEHIIHLIQSEQAVNRALWLPKFFLKYKFGVNNRANRTYDEMVKKYHDKLVIHASIVANMSKKMPITTLTNKTSYITKLDKEKKKLIEKFRKWTEHDLDTYLLPHPLMGKMTIREVVMWTAHHTEQHYQILTSKY